MGNAAKPDKKRPAETSGGTKQDKPATDAGQETSEKVSDTRQQPLSRQRIERVLR